MCHFVFEEVEIIGSWPDKGLKCTKIYHKTHHFCLGSASSNKDITSVVIKMSKRNHKAQGKTYVESVHATPHETRANN